MSDRYELELECDGWVIYKSVPSFLNTGNIMVAMTMEEVVHELNERDNQPADKENK